MLILYSYSGGAYLLVSNILYIHRISMDGSRIKTIYSANSVGRIIAIDYDYRYSYITLYSSLEQNYNCVCFCVGQTTCFGALLMKIRYGNLDLMDLRPFHFMWMIHTP